MRYLVPLLVGLLACDVHGRMELSTSTVPAAPDGPSDAVLVLPTVILSAAYDPPRQRHVLIVGDSEAGAVGPYIKRLRPRDGVTDVVSVDYVNNSTIRDWSGGQLDGDTGLFNASLKRHPDIDTVIIFLGTNDYWLNVPPDVKPVLDQISSRGLTCVWVGNTATHGKHWGINRVLRSVVSPTCTYFDTEAAGITLKDGIHPTPEAAAMWLQAVWLTIP